MNSTTMTGYSVPPVRVKTTTTAFIGFDPGMTAKVADDNVSILMFKFTVGALKHFYVPTLCLFINN